MASSGPLGWPRDLPPPLTEEFAAKVTGWLLDRGPADLRLSTIKQYPVALARVISHVLEGQIEGVRHAYANARVELGESLDAAQIAVVQAGLEAEGARIISVQRELALVEEALRR
jgi:hypothetical protein